MKSFTVFIGAGVAVHARCYFSTQGVLFILLDAITESFNSLIDLAWVTVLVCGFATAH